MTDNAAAPASEAEFLRERLVAILDWCDFAMSRPDEFNSHGVRLLDGPVFDAARAAVEGRKEVPDAD